MGEMSFYFGTGWQHIMSWDALDHLLFILALVAIYLVPQWKQILVLITAFTIGHSLTLALSVYDLIRFSEKWVEFLIPCTIIVTASFNFLVKLGQARSLRMNYFLALFFGLIHGMGFANTIRFMLTDSQSIGLPLWSFNLGLELAQLTVVAVILLVSHLLINVFKLNRTWWIWTLSATAILISLQMIAARWPF